VIVQVYLGEVAEPKLRGVLIGSPFVAYSLGILLVFALGATLHWRIVAAIASIPAAISWIAFRFLPESPVFLVRKGRLDEAQKALDWLRGGATSGQVCSLKPLYFFSLPYVYFLTDLPYKGRGINSILDLRLPPPKPKSVKE